MTRCEAEPLASCFDEVSVGISFEWQDSDRNIKFETTSICNHEPTTRIQVFPAVFESERDNKMKRKIKLIANSNKFTFRLWQDGMCCGVPQQLSFLMSTWCAAAELKSKYANPFSLRTQFLSNALSPSTKSAAANSRRKNRNAKSGISKPVPDKSFVSIYSYLLRNTSK